MNKFILGFVKVTGVLPAVIYLKRKVYYENKEIQGKKLTGKTMIVSNHTGLRDYVTYLFLFFRYSLWFLAAEVLYKKPNNARLIKHLGAIRVNRDTHEVDFFANAISVLEENKILLVFPEGRISATKKLLPFNTSAAYIAYMANAKIVPVVTDGNYGFFKRVHVMIGEPLYLRDYLDKQYLEKNDIIKLNDILRNRILELQQKLANELKK